MTNKFNKKDDDFFDMSEKISYKDIYGLLYLLKIVLDIREFLTWISKNNKRLENKGDSILEGYKLFIRTAIYSLIKTLELSSLIDEDFIFHRARFKGVHIEDIPNTCDKTKLIKYIWKSSRDLRKAKNFNELSKAANDFLSKIEKLYEIIINNLTFVEKTIDKELVKKIIILEILYTYFFDIYDGESIFRPYGLFASTLKIERPDINYMLKVFPGYFLTIQYVLYHLFGQENLKNSIFKDLNTLYENVKDDANNIIDLEIRYLELFNLSKDINSKKKYKEMLEKCKYLFSLHLSQERLIDFIKPFLVEKFKEMSQVRLFFQPIFIQDKVKEEIKELISNIKLEDPEYICNRHKSKNALFKWLDYKLLWYDFMDILDNQKVHFFNGPAAFLAVLYGILELTGEVTIRVFKHPIGKNSMRKPTYWYTYAILVPISSGLIDASGWLIFYECTIDDIEDNFHLRIKYTLDMLKEEGIIDIEEIEINEKDFLKYLKIKLEYTLPDTKINIYTKRLTGFLGNLQGHLFEYVIYEWLINNKNPKEKCRIKMYSINGIKIDVIKEQKDKIILYECKLNLEQNQVKEVLDQIRREIEALYKEFKKEIKPVIIVYNKVDSKTKREIKKNNVEIIDCFKQNITNKETKRLLEENSLL